MKIDRCGRKRLTAMPLVRKKSGGEVGERKGKGANGEELERKQKKKKRRKKKRKNTKEKFYQSKIILPKKKD